MRTMFLFSTAHVCTGMVQDPKDPMITTMTIPSTRDPSLRSIWMMVEPIIAYTHPDIRRRFKNLLPYLPLVAVGQVIEIRRKRDPRILRNQETTGPASLMDQKHSSLSTILLRA